VGRQSSIDRLPEEVQAEIGRLRQKGHTIDDILVHLRGMEGVEALERVSRSALGRHIKEMDEIGERLRFTRQVSEMLNRHIDGAPGSAATQLNVELMQGQLTEMVMKLERGVTLDADSFGKMCKGIADLTRASKTNQDFIAAAEKRAAERARAEALTEAADKAEACASQAGLSAERAAQIRRDVLGLRAVAHG